MNDYMKVIIEALKQWANKRFAILEKKINNKVDSVNGMTGDVVINIPKIPEQVQSDWSQTDETAVDFIKNKPDETDALVLAMELGFIDSVTTAADGSIYTDENGVVYTI